MVVRTRWKFRPTRLADGLNPTPQGKDPMSNDSVAPHRPTGPKADAARLALLRAATELLAASVDLSISRIASEAGVSRVTFYAHFSGVDALLGELLRQQLSDEPFSLRTFVHSYAERRDAYRHVLEQTQSRAVLETTVDATRRALLDVDDDPAPGRIPSDDALAAEAAFVAWGYVGVLDAWMRQDPPMPEETIVETLTRLTPPHLLRP